MTHLTGEQREMLRYIQRAPLPCSFRVYGVTPDVTIYTEEERAVYLKRVQDAWWPECPETA